MVLGLIKAASEYHGTITIIEGSVCLSGTFYTKIEANVRWSLLHRTKIRQTLLDYYFNLVPAVITAKVCCSSCSYPPPVFSLFSLDSQQKHNECWLKISYLLYHLPEYVFQTISSPYLFFGLHQIIALFYI